MKNKFNLKPNKIAIRFTDESVSYFKIMERKPLLQVDKDVKSIKKWEFSIFGVKVTSVEEKPIDKFRNKFVKLFLSQ
uniref:Ribosomal protein L31 n=1 Tax=Storeatula sp. CCMP1868 TaxID=195070 RepID=A0A2P1G858_9CRYP|nr:ribosomal protein L31 [Storeatula sp. CCMP1868]AVM81148.1 ribosomal protein L31 [Storeatula sp. CCMP1868]